MATKKPDPKAKKKSDHTAGWLLDMVGIGVREVGMPIPDSLIDVMKKKKKPKVIKKKKSGWF